MGESMKEEIENLALWVQKVEYHTKNWTGSLSNYKKTFLS